MSLMYEDAARQPDQEPACLIGDPDAVHYGHHVHVGPNYSVCSCGKGIGVWSVVVPDNDGHLAFWEKARCRICGADGLIWAQDR